MQFILFLFNQINVSFFHGKSVYVCFCIRQPNPSLLSGCNKKSLLPDWNLAASRWWLTTDNFNQGTCFECREEKCWGAIERSVWCVVFFCSFDAVSFLIVWSIKKKAKQPHCHDWRKWLWYWNTWNATCIPCRFCSILLESSWFNLVRSVSRFPFLHLWHCESNAFSKR